MTVREKMIQWRKSFLLSRRDMADRIGCSVDILGMVENGEVTHPAIAHRIGEAYGLTELETEELMPRNYRLHGDDYEPDRYVFHPPTDPVVVPPYIHADTYH